MHSSKHSLTLATMYRGSVKDLLGPVRCNGSSAVVFDYSDAYSVFDWGRMPDLLPKKGEALAVLAADFFEKLEKPSVWKEYSKSAEALNLRKANRFGAVFNELGEELQSVGLRTHYLGVRAGEAGQTGQEDINSQPMEAQVVSLNLVRQPFRQILVKQVSVQKPSYVSILGRNLPDYSKTNQSPKPKLVPLEVVFRFECAEESSILGRSLRDPHYLASLGFPEFQAFVGAQWDFPVLELFTKLETTDRAVPLSEALAISGLSAEQLQEVLLKTAWVAGLMRFWMNRTGLHLADGKLEWAVSEEGQCFLVDAIGPDELRMMKAGTPLSKEFLRTYYRSTSWFAALEKGKAQARLQGISEWKRFVQEAPPALSPRFREVATQLYLALSNELTARRWFADAWSLDQVVRELQQIQSQGQGVEGLK